MTGISLRSSMRSFLLHRLFRKFVGSLGTEMGTKTPGIYVCHPVQMEMEETNTSTAGCVSDLVAAPTLYLMRCCVRLLAIHIYMLLIILRLHRPHPHPTKMPFVIPLHNTQIRRSVLAPLRSPYIQSILRHHPA